MDQSYNQNPESTGSGVYFQSHFVPAEKPYAVYAYVWDYYSHIAQRIGTVLVGKMNDKGKVEFKGKAVYRMPQEEMPDDNHCVIPEDMGNFKCFPIPLGFVGDTVGMEELVKVVSMDLEYCESPGVKRFIKNMQLAGLKVELAEERKMQEIECDIDIIIFRGERKKHYCLEVKKDIALRVCIWSSGESERAPFVIDNLWDQIRMWQEIGVTFEKIKMTDNEAIYQDQVDNLLEITKIYDKYMKIEQKESRLFDLLYCRDAIGKDRCFIEDLAMELEELHDDKYKCDEDLQWAISVGLATRDGNIIQFTPEFERMATWQWTWKNGEDKK